MEDIHRCVTIWTPPPECGRQVIAAYLRKWVQEPENAHGVFLIPRILQCQWGRVARYVKEAGIYLMGALTENCRFDSHLPFVLLHIPPHRASLCNETGWSCLPVPSHRVGINIKLNRCVGCLRAFRFSVQGKWLLLVTTLWQSIPCGMFPCRPSIRHASQRQQRPEVSKRSRPITVPKFCMQSLPSPSYPPTGAIPLGLRLSPPLLGKNVHPRHHELTSRKLPPHLQVPHPPSPTV
jgi:hypothetical protein